MTEHRELADAEWARHKNSCSNEHCFVCDRWSSRRVVVKWCPGYSEDAVGPDTYRPSRPEHSVELTISPPEQFFSVPVNHLQVYLTANQNYHLKVVCHCADRETCLPGLLEELCRCYQICRANIPVEGEP